MNKKIKPEIINDIFQKIDSNNFSENETLFLTTLYVSEQGSKITLDNERLVITKHDIVLFSVLCRKIKQIIIFGNISLTGQVQSFCMDNNIPIFFLTMSGNYRGRMIPENYSETRNLKNQFFYNENTKSKLKTSKAFIAGKVRNYAVLCRNLFKVEDRVFEEINNYSYTLYKSKDFDELRGYEGISASTYFREIKQRFSHFGFEKRVKRPPTDIVNSLLSFGYTILYSNMISILTINSLNPYIGIFHEESANHASLASDLIEEFRAYAIDKVIFESLMNNEFTTEDFIISEDGAYYLKNDARKKFISIIEKSFNKIYKHPETGYEVSLKRIMDLQAKKLARVIKGEEKDYIPMLF